MTGGTLRKVVEVSDYSSAPHNTMEKRALRLVEQKIQELEGELRSLLVIREALDRHQ